MYILSVTSFVIMESAQVLGVRKTGPESGMAVYTYVRNSRNVNGLERHTEPP